MARQRAIPRGANVWADTGSLCERSTSTSSSQRWKRNSTGRVSKAHWAMRLRLVMSVIGILTRHSGLRGRHVLEVRAAFLHDGAQILTELLERRSPDVPPAVVDSVDRQVGLDRKGVRHRHETMLEAGRRLLHDVELANRSPLEIAAHGGVLPGGVYRRSGERAERPRSLSH